jgi:hypothetical protein
VDDRVKPGHDDKRMAMGVVIIETWYKSHATHAAAISMASH